MSASLDRTLVKSNRVEVYLEISGFEDITHAHITASLGREPSKVYIKGQRVNPKMGRLSPLNRWLLFGYSPDQSYPLFEDQMDALSAWLKPHFEALRALAHCYACEVKCAVMIYPGNEESTPSVHLEKRHVQWLDALRAEFDVDIYCLEP